MCKICCREREEKKNSQKFPFKLRKKYKLNRRRNPNKDALKGYLNERLQLKPTGIEPGTGLIKIFARGTFHSGK